MKIPQRHTVGGQLPEENIVIFSDKVNSTMDEENGET